MKKIRYRYLVRTVFAFTAITALFSALLFAFFFSEALAREKQHALDSLSACRMGIQSAYASGAIQGAKPDADSLLRAAQQYEKTASLASGGREEVRIRLSRKTFYAEAGFLLGKDMFTLSIERSIAPLYENMQSMLSLYRALYLIFIPLGAAVMYGAGRSVTRPIEALTLHANAIAQGDFAYRSHVHTQDETGVLAAAFNRMSDSVQSEIARREELIGSLAHEMKTPLQAIIGHTSLAYMGKRTEEERLLALKTVLHEAERLNRLSERMLSWVRAGSEAFAALQPSDISTLLENVRAAFETRADIRIHAEDGCVLADPTLTETLFSNLIDNALNAGAKEISVSCVRQENGFLFTVQDDGCGMTKEALIRAEEPFWREDKARARERGGAGLGLSLCARIAGLHASKLNYASEKGKGTSVSFALREAQYEK